MSQNDVIQRLIAEVKQLRTRVAVLERQAGKSSRAPVPAQSKKQFDQMGEAEIAAYTLEVNVNRSAALNKGIRRW